MPTEVTYGPQAAIAARPIAPTTRKPPNHDSATLRAMQAASRAKSEAIDADIQKWYDSSEAYAHELAAKYDKDAQHFLGLMFSGGLKKQKNRKPNAYNGWQRRLMMEANKGAQPGDRVGLIETSTEYRDSYHKLSDETKEELKEEVQDARESRQMGFRLNQRGRLADANNVWKQITELLKGLKARVGIEAMVLMVRNNHEFTMDPRWYITASQIDDYLGTNFKGWDLEKIGALVEAFSVAGCDFMSFYRTAREKAEHLKKLIRQKILEGLATITGESNIQMNYINYEQEIIFRRGVILRGWLLSEFKNPSELSTSIPPLKAQWQALQSGACRWEKTTPEEREKLKASFAEKLAGGQVKKRKERSDKGKKHARPKKSRAKGKGKEAATAAAVATAGGDVEKESSDDDESGDDGEGQSRKRRRVAEPKSAEFVPDDADD
ncbi:uncharacterized protein B0H18DRAFT_1114864 [Fomitopsis serialis]|uniref:uncharacterized protein n=1 Tax=Fomitopsis serialis TaxID=139415 RepID=UPI0020084F99|nr:uncharacterized protein B0H18DRAFT_1114864 [Neoantrodia serialis]KAH9934120.1 hypothetical protein B0H18DRAFT_1114864 [Neoantrodia serialis]